MPSSKLFQSWAFLAPNAPARVGEISPVGTQDDVGALAGVRLAPSSRSRHSAGVVSAIMGLRSTIGLIKGPQHSREVCYLFKGERWIQSQILFNAEPRKEHRYQVAYRCGQARTLDFTHAATESNIAQPPFSRQIRQLEEEVGCQAARKVQRRLTVDVARNSSINARAAIRSLVSKPSSNRW